MLCDVCESRKWTGSWLVRLNSNYKWHIMCIFSSCSFSVARLICFSGQLKEQGNAAFKAGQLKFARGKYTKALRLADHIFDIETEEQVICSKLTNALIYVGAAVGHKLFRKC